MTPFAIQATLHWFGVAGYIAAMVLLTHAVIFARPERVRWALWALIIGLLPHGIALLHRWAQVGHGPYMLKYEAMSSNGWVALLFLAVVLWRRPGWAVLGLVVLPLSILAVALGLFSSNEARDLPPTLRSIWLVFHVSFAKLALSSFLLALASSVVLLLGLEPDSAWRKALPPRDALDAYTVRFIGFGFVFWTFTVAAGAVWANQSWGRYWGWDVIETWSLITWLVYGTFLHLRFFFKFGQRPTAWLSVGSFAVFILTFLILPFFWPSLHSAYFQ